MQSRIKAGLNVACKFYAVLFIVFSSIVEAQQWNPRPGWKDSYAVDGQCYCDTNGFDHNLDSKFADTPIGSQNVVDICEAIERVLGDGPVDGRIPYNDIQCGNGPPNDAPDEVGCPGRVDIGPDGCDQIGPKWDLETVYANLPDNNEGLDNSNWRIEASHENSEVGRMVDNSLSSRWSTGTPQTPGQYITIDLGEPLSFNRIVLDSYSSNEDYPRGFSVFVSSNGNNWGSAVLSGNGNRAVTTLDLGDQYARHIKITQTGSSSNRWWSIHNLKIFGAGASNTPNPTPPTSPVHMSPIQDLILSDSKQSDE